MFATRFLVGIFFNLRFIRPIFGEVTIDRCLVLVACSGDNCCPPPLLDAKDGDPVARRSVRRQEVGVCWCSILSEDGISVFLCSLIKR